MHSSHTPRASETMESTAPSPAWLVLPRKVPPRTLRPPSAGPAQRPQKLRSKQSTDRWLSTESWLLANQPSLRSSAATSGPHPSRSARCVLSEDARSNLRGHIPPSKSEQPSLPRARDEPAPNLRRREIQTRTLSSNLEVCCRRAVPRLATTPTESIPDPRSAPTRHAATSQPRSAHHEQTEVQSVLLAQRPRLDAPPSPLDATAPPPLLSNPFYPVPALSIDRESFCPAQSRSHPGRDALSNSLLPQPKPTFFPAA